MKKLTVRMADKIQNYFSSLSGNIDRCEVISMFKLTPRDYLEVCHITLAEGASIDDVKNKLIDDVIVIKNNGRDYTCLIKGQFSGEITKFLDSFDLKLEYPIIFDGHYCQFSIVGSTRELSAIVSAIKKDLSDLEVLSLQPYDPHVSSLFSVLTEKQKEILIQAYRSGYFDRPRRINAEALAKKMGIHKTTLLEHLHRAENKLIGHLIGQTL